LVVHVATSSATTHDSKLVEAIHADSAANELLPGEHLVDQGYMDTELLLASQAQHGVELIGPCRPTTAGRRRRPKASR
jgi:transposase